MNVLCSAPRCAINEQVAFLQMISEVSPMFHLISFTELYKVSMISDALLIFLPLRTLRELKNQSRLRRRLQFIFAASALTTCASIVSGAFNLSKIAFGYIVVVEIEVSYVLSFSFLAV
jgi:hypothetical protein